jgi:hypothetical protein
MIRSIAMTACLLLSQPAKADNGGYVLQYALKTLKLNESGELKELRGTCLSACTLYLGVRNLCVGKDIKLGFHAPYGGKTPGANRDAATYMMRSYPIWVREWINARGGLTRKILYLYYADIKGRIKDCESN